MKRYFAIFLLIVSMIEASAQVPYFSSTVGTNKIYGYTSVKFRPGINSQETYTTFQYGIDTYTAAGLDLYTYNGSSYMGVLVRAGYRFNQWIGVGGQLTPSFDLSDNFKLSYITAALYLNGAITADGNFFWCSNTWYGINRDIDDTITNWEYLGYSIHIKKDQVITPMIGVIHSWKFDQDIDMAAGIYYTLKNWNFYVWGNDFFKKNPRLVIGVDFTY